MKMRTFFLAMLMATTFGLHAHDHQHPGEVNKNITPYNDAKDAMNGVSKDHLYQQAAWRTFKQQYPSWTATFDRHSKLPHRAFGAPITFTQGGNDPVMKAKAFLQQAFSGFSLPMNELVLTRNFNDGKYIHVDFKQVHQSMDVLFSRVAVRFTQDLKVIMVGLEAHPNIPALAASITPQAAKLAAEQAIVTTITETTIAPELRIIPIPNDGVYAYRPVYQVTVNTQDDKETPGKYVTYVDAVNGDILYRDNKVKHIDFNVRANGYTSNLFGPTAMLPLKHLRVNVGGTDYFSNINGLVTAPGAGPVNPTLTLAGRYIRMYTGANGNTSATFTQSGVTSGSNVDFPHSDPDATIRHMTCYYHANEIHDFMKSKLPSFTAMDNPLTTRVDRTDGNCNAFYNGSSINFYTTAAGCNALSVVNTVVYHEYGHGITNVFWDDQGSSFDNGGMGEGYSDIWAATLSNSPLIGQGFNVGQPNSLIRRYDINPKVYPQDLVGQVHADGEIIAGAWWATGSLWGSVDSMGDLFAASHYGLANGPNGTEGKVYFEILIDALQYDDDNGNLSDGTPHFSAIVNGFAAHGIYLLSNTTLDHTPPSAINAGVPFTINAKAITDFEPFLGDVKMIYRLRGATATDTITMTKSGVNYTCQFPASAAGNLYEYIFAIYDNANTLAKFSPVESAFNTGFTRRNIPYYLLVGFSTIHFEPFDNVTSTTPNWVIGNAPNDNATAGKWIVAVPVSSATNGDTVQTGKDHTTGTGKCAVTGNAVSAASSPGSADVDGGRTTLITPTYDLSSYTKPAISYWRWFSNSQSTTNGGKDLWRVWASYDNGNTWNIIERTFVPDVRWRRSVFLPDMSSGTTAKLMFTATDTTYTGVTGTWVEAAIDDIEILDLAQGTVGIQEVNSLDAIIFPNPASNELTIKTSENGIMQYQIVNTIGETILRNDRAVVVDNRYVMDTRQLSNGIYYIRMIINQKQTTHRIMISK